MNKKNMFLFEEVKVQFDSNFLSDLFAYLRAGVEIVFLYIHQSMTYKYCFKNKPCIELWIRVEFISHLKAAGIGSSPWYKMDW